jgi:hypothetical protein
MEIKTYLQYKRVYGRPSTRAELRAALANLDRATVLRLLSAISFSLDFLGGRSSEGAQETAIRRFFPQSLASQILANGDAVFHRH